MKICFATHNANKLREVREMVPQGIQVVGLDELQLTEDIPETGETIEENSAIKANYVFQKLNMPCFADDTGLEVPALNNEPGVYSARYAGPQKSSEANMDLLLKKLKKKSSREARFKTVITYIDQGGASRQFPGIVQGKIIDQKQGVDGFGYDPIFVPEGENRTFAEMTAEEKNSRSHRGKAMALLMNHLKTQII